jgi:8-oxo-dGTP pyrophosphatase MutT (NUDIX family)
MKEVSAGAVVFKQEKERKYLLLYKKAHEKYKEQWGFSRGNIEKDEDEKEAAEREIEEETGLDDLKFAEGFKEKVKFFYRKEGEMVYKEVIWFIAETKKEKVKLSFEHNDYEWLPCKEAIERLTFKEDKKLLEKADKFLESRLTKWMS